MVEKDYQDRAVTQYLLGTLPEAEAERLDELSLTDDDFVEALGAAEKDLVDAYVQGELTGAELGRFESHYLASPLRRERVKFAQAFQHIAGKEAASMFGEGETVGPAAGRKGSGWFEALRAVVYSRPAVRWGAATAALALLAAGVWLAFERTRPPWPETQANRGSQIDRGPEPRNEIAAERPASAQAEPVPGAREEGERREQADDRQEAVARRDAEQQPSPPRRQRPPRPAAGSVASFVLTPQVRAVGQLTAVSVPADTDYVSMRLELEPVDFAAYRVALLNPSSGLTLWRSSRLRAKAVGGGKALDVRFPAGLLRQGTYALRVSGIPARGASEIVSDYSFRVVK